MLARILLYWPDMQCPRIAIFDLDNTLAESFSPPRPEMIAHLERLLDLIPLSIMSAASLERMQRDIVSHLSPAADKGRLHLFTANAAQYYAWREESWREEYGFKFTDAERREIVEALKESVAETGIGADMLPMGDQLVDYQGYIAFTPPGRAVSREAKAAWDPDASKRNTLRASLSKRLPQFNVYIGGQTTIDITKKEINKAYGVRQLSERLKIPVSDMLYVGDALYEGGNDAVVIETGIPTRSVGGPSETLTALDDLLRACVR